MKIFVIGMLLATSLFGKGGGGHGGGHASSHRCTSCARTSQGRIARSSGAVKDFRVQTGHPKGWKGHVVDHVVPLCAGGADTSSNMQWQTKEEAKVKDRAERMACK